MLMPLWTPSSRLKGGHGREISLYTLTGARVFYMERFTVFRDINLEGLLGNCEGEESCQSLHTASVEQP